MKDKVVAIVLGNRLNDDGTISEIQAERLNMAMEIENLFHPDYFILSGGVANPIAKKSEARAMYDTLVDWGFNKDKLLLEDKSMTTVENAVYSIPIVKKLEAKMVIICTSLYHFKNPIYKTMESFIDELENTGITIMIYSNR